CRLHPLIHTSPPRELTQSIVGRQVRLLEKEVHVAFRWTGQWGRQNICVVYDSVTVNRHAICQSILIMG
ncbi:MAG: hypothetical protein PVF10_10385, partial [Syntrophobacterales bacterium]